MDIIKELLKDVPVPKMVKIRQSFNADEIVDVSGALATALADSGMVVLLFLHYPRHSW